MAKHDDEYITFEDMKQVTEYMGHTISRLITVLEVKGGLTADDRNYIAGKLDKDEWLKKATEPDLSTFFSMMFDKEWANQTTPDEDKEKADED